MGKTYRVDSKTNEPVREKLRERDIGRKVFRRKQEERFNARVQKGHEKAAKE